MKKFLVLIPVLLILFSQFSVGQVGVNVNSLPPNEAGKYIQPISTLLGTYFNSGTYYDADVSEFFGFKFNIVGMWMIVPDDQKTFNPDPRLSGVGNVDPTATVLGNKASYYLSNNGFFTYPSGLSLKGVPMGIYQVAGSFFNTELMLRFFPKSKFGDVKAGLFGFGIKHEISSHLPLVPLDFAVQILYNNFNFDYVGDDPVKYTSIKSSNFAFNVHASKKFAGIIIVYSGLQYESSSMDFGYYFEDDMNLYPTLGKLKHNLSLDGDNTIRFTLGGAVKLGFFVFNADLNLTKFTTFTTGLSLDF